MAISFAKNHSHGVITLTGPFTASVAESFRGQFINWFQADPEIRRVVIDLGAVTFMDSSGLGAVIGVLKRVAERGGELALARPQSSVKLVLQITRADRIIKVCDTLEAALV